VCGTEPINRVHVGTTAFTNALIERRHLETVGAIRVGAPVSESLPPMIDWHTMDRSSPKSCSSATARCA
jgi:N-methylhydantoinase A/oxoprolinase/acetone carboxylase beta subunit